MQFPRSPWKVFDGQNDVLPGIHVPMIYERVPASLPDWEYHILSIDMREAAPPDEETLNELGKQGWLLVSVLEQRGSLIHYYFVREKDS